jgi:hypothetical protein
MAGSKTDFGKNLGAGLEVVVNEKVEMVVGVEVG